MEGRGVNYSGRMTRSELVRYGDPSWIVKDEGDDIDSSMLESHLGGFTSASYYDLDWIMNDLKACLNRVKDQKYKEGKNVVEEKMDHISCSNFVRTLLPKLSQRDYPYFPWLEIVMQLVDDAAEEEGKYQVLCAFPSDPLIRLAILDAVKTSSKDGKVFITNLRVRDFRQSYGDLDIGMGPDHRLNPEDIRAAHSKIAEGREDEDSNMDLVLYVSERVGPRMSQDRAAKIQVLEGIEALLLGLSFLKDGGSLVIQTFYLDNSNWIPTLYVLSCLFSTVTVRKPLAANRHTGEVYVVAIGFQKEKSLPFLMELSKYHDSKEAETDALNGESMLETEALPAGFVQKAKEAINNHTELRMKFINRALGIMNAPKKSWAYIELFNWKKYFAKEWAKKWRIEERLGLLDPIENAEPTFYTRKELMDCNIASIVEDFVCLRKGKLGVRQRPIDDEKVPHVDKLHLPSQKGECDTDYLGLTELLLVIEDDAPSHDEEKAEEKQEESGLQPVEASGENQEEEAGENQEEEAGEKQEEEAGEKQEEEAGEKQEEEAGDQPDEESGERAEKESGDKTEEESGDKTGKESGDKTDEKPEERAEEKPEERAEEKPEDPLVRLAAMNAFRNSRWMVRTRQVVLTDAEMETYAYSSDDDYW